MLSLSESCQLAHYHNMPNWLHAVGSTNAYHDNNNYSDKKNAVQLMMT